MNMETHHSSPTSAATTLAAFVDTLLPGDDLFPSAATAGTQGIVAYRVRERAGAEALDRLVAALSTSGRPFADLDQADRIVAVRRFERDEPDLFSLLRAVTYYAYYESPAVTAAIRSIGHDYNDAPQPLGYVMAPFDPTPGVNLPATLSGSYKRTDEITRLDLSSLGDLALPVQED